MTELSMRTLACSEWVVFAAQNFVKISPFSSLLVLFQDRGLSWQGMNEWVTTRFSVLDCMSDLSCQQAF